MLGPSHQELLAADHKRYLLQTRIYTGKSRKCQGSLGEGLTPHTLAGQLFKVCPSSLRGTKKSVVSSPEDTHCMILLALDPAGHVDSWMGSGLVRYNSKDLEESCRH